MTVENLEPRRLLSATISNRVLIVTATGGDDAVTVALVSGSSSTVSVTQNGAGQGSFSTAAFDRVQVDAGAGNDTVMLLRVANGQRTGVVPRRATLNGGEGNDYLVGGSSGDTLNGGNGDDRLDGWTGADAFNGGAGVDTADYGARTAALRLSINNIADDGSGGEGDNVKPDIENLTGGSNADTLRGSSGPNVLRGGGGGDQLFGEAGDDTLDGGTGADSLNGGTGTDTVTYASRTSAVFVDPDGAADDGQSGEKDNVKTDVENLVGGSGNDRLAGGPRDNVLDGGPGRDSLFGGAGLDTVTYASRAAAVRANLDGAANDGQAGESDAIAVDVENLVGGSGDDTLTGNHATNVLRGGAGNDTISALAADDVVDGGTGTDTMAGGTGNDTADYAGRADKLLLDLDGVADDGADGENDRIGSDVENLHGGAGDDTLTGSALSNVLRGGAGNDTLRGGDGDDTLDGGSSPALVRLTGGVVPPFRSGLADGNDNFLGGNGVDRADYSARLLDLTVSLDGQGGDGAKTINENDNVAADVEGLVGGFGGDTLTGNDRPNVLIGGTGNDVINGNGGDDIIEGGLGADDLNGGAGDDIFNNRSGLPGTPDSDSIDGGSGFDFFQGDIKDSVAESERNYDPDPQGLIDGPNARGGGGEEAAAAPELVSVVAPTVAGGVLTVTGTSSGETIQVTQSGGNISVTIGASAFGPYSTANVTRVTVNAGSGNDVVRLRTAAGSNPLLITSTLNGQGGNDTLVGGNGNDIFDCGNALDGNDTMTGHSGTDKADYSRRTGNLNVELNGVALDGQVSAGESDLVATDVEVVFAGSGSDTITGGTAGETLSGGGGADTIAGNGGTDFLVGSSGADFVLGGDGGDYLTLADGVADTYRLGSAAYIDFPAIDTDANGNPIDILQPG